MPRNIFLSHAHNGDDQLLANALQDGILQCCPEGTRVFRSSDVHSRGSISYGEDWYRRVTDELQTADALIALVTPASSAKPWIHYETGFAMGRGIKLSYAIVAPSLSPPDLGPLSHSQAAQFTDDGILKLFRELAQFAGTQPVDSQLGPLARNTINRAAVPLKNVFMSGATRQESFSSFLKLDDRLLKSIDDILSGAESSDNIQAMLRRWTAAASLCSAAVPWLQLPLAQLYKSMVAGDLERLNADCDELSRSLALVEELAARNPSPTLEDACTILRTSLDDISRKLHPAD